jgi:hypothetical protein
VVSTAGIGDGPARTRRRELGRALVVGAWLGALACGEPDDDCSPSPGRICTFVGTGKAGRGDEGQDRLRTELYLPQDVTVGASGELFILDWNNHRVLAVDAAGSVRRLLGTGEVGDGPDGDARAMAINHPTHLALAPSGALVVAVWHNSKLIEFDPATETAVTLAGNGARDFGGDGGPLADALFDLPVATAFDRAGDMFITDQGNQRIRKVDGAGIVRTYAGNGIPGFSGDGGPAAAAQVRFPGGDSPPPSGRLVVDRAGNLYFADSGNHRVRKIDPGGTISTVAGNGDPTFAGDGGPAVSASLARPSDVEVDDAGNLYIADTDNACVRRVDPAGVITTIAGRCGAPGFAGDGGPATAALLEQPYGLALAGDDRLYVADTLNHRIRLVYLE